MKQLTQLKGSEDNVSLASEKAYLSQLRNVNSWLSGYFSRAIFDSDFSTSTCFFGFFFCFFPLQVRVTCAPQTSRSGGWTTPRTSTPTGWWAAGPAPRAPSRLSSR